MPRTNDPTITICRQLCTPCLHKAIIDLTKQQALDITFMYDHAPDSWSRLTQALAQHCAARRGAPAPVYPHALPLNGAQRTPVESVQETAAALLRPSVEEDA